MQLTISLKREQGHFVQDAREDASLYMAMYQAAIGEQFPSAPREDLEPGMIAPNNALDIIFAYCPLIDCHLPPSPLSAFSSGRDAPVF